MVAENFRRPRCSRWRSRSVIDWSDGPLARRPARHTDSTREPLERAVKRLGPILERRLR
jgi:hypothetical protein